METVVPTEAKGTLKEDLAWIWLLDTQIAVWRREAVHKVTKAKVRKKKPPEQLWEDILPLVVDKVGFRLTEKQV